MQKRRHKATTSTLHRGNSQEPVSYRQRSLSRFCECSLQSLPLEKVEQRQLLSEEEQNCRQRFEDETTFPQFEGLGSCLCAVFNRPNVLNPVGGILGPALPFSTLNPLHDCAPKMSNIWKQTTICCQVPKHHKKPRTLNFCLRRMPTPTLDPP